MYCYLALIGKPGTPCQVRLWLGLVIIYFDLNFAYFWVILGTVGQGIIGLSMWCASRPFWSSKISIDVLESPSSIGVQRLLLDCIFAGKSIANSVAATLSCNKNQKVLELLLSNTKVKAVKATSATSVTRCHHWLMMALSLMKRSFNYASL